jgi:uncharacterized protein (TIGR02231 family)
MEKIAATTITKTTVYTDRALVTRTGTVSLSGAEQFLILEHLPTTIDAESLRVSGRAPVPVKILSANLELKRFKEPVAEKVAAVTAEIEELEQQQHQRQIQIETAQMQNDFVSGLRLKMEDAMARSLPRQKVNLTDTVNFIDFIGSKFSEYALAIEDYRLQQKELTKQLEVLRSRLKSFSNRHAKESYQLKIHIENSAETELHLEISYVVLQASWKPLYDMRIDTATKKIELNYLAEIQQRSGEDWQDVQLTLSTAKPGLGSLPPQLAPWYVDMRSAVPIGAMMAGGAAAPAPATTMRVRRVSLAENNDNDDYESEDFVEAETVQAVATESGGVVNFQIAGGGNIPNDGRPYKTTIYRDELPIQLVHVAMPKIVSFPYLQAKIKNPNDGVTLLPGKANIFRDGMFVGTSDLQNIAPNQEFKLNLGIDERIRIDRELVERLADKKFLGGNRRVTYAYRIKIENLQAQPVTLEISEQIPHSRNEKIKVKLLKSVPETPVEELGRIDWSIALAANQKLEVYYQFSIEHPEDIQIVGLNI